MIHFGDIRKIKGGEVPITDCVIGGSPCQDLSVAGNRAGLTGERSGLFMEQIRVIREMREHDKTAGRADKFIRPRFMVWENVPGAFSSNKGEDFRKVLEETARIADKNAAIPRPPKSKWTNAGCIMGDGWSVAWRIFDAQFWGVPQRRRRIALVADFGGQCAPEILFERESVSGDTEESGKAREGAAGSIEIGPNPPVAKCNDEKPDKSLCIAFKSGQGAKAGSMGMQEEVSPTLTGVSSGTNQVPAVAVCEPVCLHPDVAGTICASGAGTNRPAGQGNETDLCIVQSVAGEGTKNLTPGESQTNRIYDSSGVFPALCANETSGLNRQAVMCMAHSMPHAEICEDLSPTLTCHHEQPFISSTTVVRRLTPRECERLQGYPDGWTDIGDWTDSKGKVHKTSDSARYKALGNSIALPPWTWVLKRLCSCYDRPATMASLFDGIGGFPLIWERINGPGSCMWASETEEFPLAVTKKRLCRGMRK